MAAELFRRNNEYAAKILLDQKVDIAFVRGDASHNYQWPVEIGTELKIRLPNDYSVKD